MDISVIFSFTLRIIRMFRLFVIDGNLTSVLRNQIVYKSISGMENLFGCVLRGRPFQYLLLFTQSSASAAPMPICFW